VTYFQPPPDVPAVSVADLATALPEGAALIDVREPDEYGTAHVPGAQLIPLGQVVARVGEVTRDGTVYVICQTGNRSARAVQWYRAQGIDAVNVEGGTKAWVESGKPYDIGP
jgi:rhodanese-related sulfurtransferase